MSGILHRVDHQASTGVTVWHRASALSKMALMAALLAGVVTQRRPEPLIALHALAWIMALSARLPGRLIAAALGYPALFAFFFVASSWDGTWSTPAVLLLRVFTASLAAMWLVGTTPYPDLFAPLSRVLPRTIGDGLFLTYRAFFALVDQAEQMWRALRIRGGLGPRGLRSGWRSAGRVGEALGTLVLQSFERSQRLYGALRLRGHEGRVCGCRHYAEMGVADLLPFGVALAVAAGLVWAELR